MGSDRPVYASVVIDGGPPKPLDYSVPSHLTISEGMSVEVPMRGKKRRGLVVALKSKPDFARTLPINGVLDKGLPADLLKLADWMSGYYFSPKSQVIRSMLPASVRKGTKPKQQLAVRPKKTREELRKLSIALLKKRPAQARLIEGLLKVKKEILLTELIENTGASRSSVTSLEKEGLIELVQLAIDRSPLADQEYFPSRPKALSPEQKKALDAIDKPGFAAHLLYGVTGSGKTEVYLQAIEKVLARSQGAIILVPEIALTGQTLERFRSRFEEKIALLHHRLSDGERFDEWQKIRAGTAPIVIGPRSAIFSPVSNLGLIIVDEEHEGSYKQSDSSPFYNARDVAVMRAHLLDIPVVLGSATPSLASFYNAKSGKYNLLTLPTRADSAQMPTIEIIDLTREKGLLSDTLLTTIKERWEVGEQSILFLNRRGYHSMQWCASCKEPIKCPHCDLSLTFHRGQNRLSCHLCSHTLSPPPRTCPTCGGPEPLTFRGAGTEQVERSLHAIFPEIRTLRVDADTTRHKGSHEKLLRQFRTGKADVLIGTQMIAKGLHFPQVTLVGVLNSDITLNIPDFRSSEQVFALITQVAGRAGRGKLPGRVLIQTRMPENEAITLAQAQDFEAFYNHEIALRKMFHYPPYTHLIKLTFSGPDEDQTLKTATTIQETLTRHTQEVLPVTPCGYAKIKDQYRFQFLLRGPSVYTLNAALDRVQPHTLCPRGVRCRIDVDPLTTFF